MHRIGNVIGIGVACSILALGQSRPPAAVPARMIVTAGHFYSHEPPVLTAKDLALTQSFEPLTITNLVPLNGALELYVLVDDCSSCEAATKFDELRRFVLAQPASTSVGVAYIQEGKLVVVEKPTRDRTQAVKALNPPTGGVPANPFAPLADLIKGWEPAPQARRAVLMISNGIDPTVPKGLLDPSADAAIEAAERAEVTIFAMYHPSADYSVTDASTMYAGQVQLAHVANESGGEAYLVGFGPLPSLAPFLADVADHLANQYRLEFLAEPAEGLGALKDVIVNSTLPDIEVMAPARAWIPGTGTPGKGQ